MGYICIPRDICQLIFGFRTNEPRRSGFKQDSYVFKSSLAGFRDYKSRTCQTSVQKFGERNELSVTH